MHKLLLLLILLVSPITWAKITPLDVHKAYQDKALELTRNCVGFSAPVAARALAYLNITKYLAYSQDQKVAGKIGIELPKLTIKGKNRTKFFNDVCYYSLVSYFPSMTTKQLSELNDLREKLHTSAQTKTIDSLAQAFVNSIFERSLTDGSSEAYLNNFPTDYSPPSGKGLWSKTPPGYFSSLLPYFGETRLVIPSNYDLVSDLKPMKYSTDSTSQIFQESLAVWKIGVQPTQESEIVAEYWDDAPGVSATPAGHLSNIAQQLLELNKSKLKDQLFCHMALSVAIFDAAVLSWKLKYTYHFIRPITYIQQNIDPYFNSIIASPPFPEYPSGHSFQSGAAVGVLTHFFPRQKEFTDLSHHWRSDIDGSPRTFSTIQAMGEEISNSRFYGGIHFPTTLKESLDAGISIGQNTIKQLSAK